MTIDEDAALLAAEEEYNEPLVSEHRALAFWFETDFIKWWPYRWTSFFSFLEGMI
jgi:hypothetical protein